jgi:ribosome maturation factor RimP
MMVKSIEKDIETLVEKILDRDDLFFIDVKVTGHSDYKKILVHIDSDNGLDIGTCSSVSKKLSDELDYMDLPAEKYTLEVSSPGIDQPFKLRRQYVKNTGKTVKVVLHDNEVKKGKLLQVDKEEIIIEIEIKEKKKKVRHDQITIPFNDIKKTNVIVTF